VATESIQTLLGPIDAGKLGVTYFHEHILTNPPLWRMKEDPDYYLDSMPRIIEELERFRQAGGCTLVDATCIDYGRDAKAMVEVAKAVKVNILGLTGFNRGDYGEQWVRDASIEELAELMISDVLEGMDGTSARAAMIKVGTSYNTILPVEERFFEAAAIAHKETGAPIMTHTSRGTMGLEQLDLLEEHGVDPARVALCHLDQNLDFWYLRNLARRGAYIEFDGPSKVKYAPDSARIEMLKRLVDEGFGRQILISGDMGRRSYLKAYGGGPGFGFLLEKFIPRLLDEGFGQGVVSDFFENNPRRFMTS